VAKPIVVVAEDDPGLRHLFDRALTAGGYKVLPAMDVREAMDCLRRPGVRGAILDMLFTNSGGRSGLDVLRFIRSDQFLRHMPVMVLTGFQLNRDVLAQVEELHAEVWVKPVHLAQLVTRLGQLVERVPQPA
jgi:two-component system phosphate regulon response regulator PhoB